MARLTSAEVAQHSSPDSLWLVVKGQVYDVYVSILDAVVTAAEIVTTEFQNEHPGGSRVLVKYGGADATEEYEPIHPPDAIQSLPPSKHLGPLADPENVKTVKQAALRPVDPSAAPPLEHNLTLDDIEASAQKLLSPKAWAYYRSAADHERAFDANASIWSAIRFRPRVLRGVTQFDIGTSILGFPVRSPVLVAPAALARLAHPDGEQALVRAAGAHGLIYCMSANASMSPEDIAAARLPDQVIFYQIYVNVDRSKSIDVLRRVKALGFKAIVVTADAPIPGKRTLDERHALTDTIPNPVPDRVADAPAATAPAKQSVALSAFASGFDPDLKWDDLKWIREVTGLPIVVKGIMSADDAARCVDAGVDAIWLSNHGGRQLEDAPTSLEILLEIRKHCLHVLAKCEVYLDGGVRHGTDAVKALCLGAKAVAVGRPFMYSLAYGEAGARRVSKLLEDEIAVAMRLLGCNTLDQLHPRLVNTRRLDPLLSNDYEGSSRWRSLLSKL